MSTRSEAEAVLRKQAERLREAGAHALHVESGRGFGLRGAVIVAWVPKEFHGKLPDSVSATVGGKKVAVPVKAKPKEPFQPESL